MASSAAAAPAEAGLAYAGFARAVVQRRAACREAIVAAEAEVATQHDKLQACYHKLRALELAQDYRQRRAAAEVAHRESMALDEIALLTRSRQ